MNLSDLLRSSSLSVGGTKSKSVTEFIKIPDETAGYKKVFPMRGETLSVRIFYNEKSQLLFRAIDRHKYVLPSSYSTNAPCLKAMFGMDCPICNAIKTITDIKGEDIFGQSLTYNKKFPVFAYINSIKNKSQYHEVNPGETVILMLPKMVVKELINVMESCSSEEDFNKFFNSNNCLSFTISVDNEVSMSMYKIMPDALMGQTKLFETDEQFNNFMHSLPNLNDLIVPTTFDEKYLTYANQVADELNKNYLSGSTEETTMKNIENETKANDILNSINKIANEFQPQTQTQAQVQPQPVVQQLQYQTQATTIPSQFQPAMTSSQIQPSQSTSTIIQPQQTVVSTTETKSVENVAAPVKLDQPVQNNVPSCFGNYNELEAKCLICANSVECSTKKVN